LGSFLETWRGFAIEEADLVILYNIEAGWRGKTTIGSVIVFPPSASKASDPSKRMPSRRRGLAVAEEIVNFENRALCLKLS
jgi:hypothetical protein